MALKDFNYKQFFFDHGERIGLGAAGVVALLLGLSLFIPGSGLFLIGSAGANADVLTKGAETVDNGIRTNQPTDADKPGDPTEKLVAFNFDLIGPAKARDYEIAGLYVPGGGGPAGRGKPDIFWPRESQVALVRIQLPSLIFDNKLEYVETLKNFTAAAGPAGGMGQFMPNMQMMRGMFPGGSQQRGSGGYDPRQALLNNASGKKAATRNLKDRANGGDKKEDATDFDTEWKKVDALDKDANAKLAEQAYPMRMAEIVASFPYKQQVQEFRDKLRLAHDEDVTNEMSLETKDGQAQKAFRFLGVNVERRQIDAKGKPVGDKEGWVKLDLEGSYKPLVILDGRRFEEDDPKLMRIIFPGLVMKKLATFGERRTPPLEEYSKAADLLPSVAATLEALDKRPDAAIAKPALTADPGSIFQDPNAVPAPGANGITPGPGGAGPGGTSGSGAGAPPGSTTGSGGPRPPFSRPPIGSDSATPPGPEGFKPGQEVAIPDACLIRLFDVTVEAGKTYEYRLQVRMANPSFGRTDAASMGFAQDNELTPKQWYVVPQKLTVPSDIYYYAVDQKELDAREPKPAPDKDKTEGPKEKELKLPYQPVRENQTMLQMHRWLDMLHKNRVDVPVGDWVIAERAVVTRGEPITPQRVEVPYWRTTQDRFTMATDLPPTKSGTASKLPPSVEVPFAPENEAPVVVDFTEADRNYQRTHPKTDDAAPADKAPAVKDRAALEVLLYTADGRLIAHDSSRDAPDPERAKRLQEVREWIQNVKSTKGSKDNTDPLGGGTKAP